MPSPSIVQTFVGSAFNSSGSTATAGSNIQAGNVLVALWYANAITGLPSNPTGCVTWTQAGQTLGFANGAASGTWTVGPVVTGGSCTVSIGVPSGGGSFSTAIAVWEVTGVTTTVDGTPGFSWMNVGTSVSGPSTTTSTSGDMILTINNYQTAPVTVSSPFVADVSSATAWSNISNAGLIMAHLVQGSSGSVNANYTLTSSAMNMAILALPPSGFQPDEDFWVAPPPAPTDSIISIF